MWMSHASVCSFPPTSLIKGSEMIRSKEAGEPS